MIRRTTIILFQTILGSHQSNPLWTSHFYVPASHVKAHVIVVRPRLILTSFIPYENGWVLLHNHRFKLSWAFWSFDRIEYLMTIVALEFMVLDFSFSHEIGKKFLTNILNPIFSRNENHMKLRLAKYLELFADCSYTIQLSNCLVDVFLDFFNPGWK